MDPILIDEMHLVPWKDWNEWDNVRLLLFSKNYESRKLGTDFVWMWKSRLRKIAPAVITTAEIVTLLFPLEVGGPLDHAWCLGASMSLVRAVNLLVEPQQKKKYAVSVSSIAKKLGIPEWIVRIRHQATHNAEIPSPQLLIKACKNLLSWIKINYWDTQSELVNDADQKTLSILKEIAIDKRAKSFVTRREKRLIEKICRIEALETPHKTLAFLMIKNGLLFNDENSKNLFQNNGPKKNKNVFLAWIGILEELEAKWPKFMLELMTYCLQYLNGTAEDVYTYADTIIQAKHCAKFCFLRSINNHFASCIKIITSIPSSITYSLLRDAIKVHPHKKKSINRIIDALSHLKKQDYSLIKIPSPSGSQHDVPTSSFSTEPWSLSDAKTWNAPCSIGMLPQKTFFLAA